MERYLNQSKSSFLFTIISILKSPWLKHLFPKKKYLIGSMHSTDMIVDRYDNENDGIQHLSTHGFLFNDDDNLTFCEKIEGTLRN